MVSWARFLVLIAGVMGVSGVVMAAAGSHAGGGDLVRLAAEFLLIHAGVVLCIGIAVERGLRPASVWLIAATALASGTLVFSTDLGLIGFLDARPFPLAAPIGGLLMIMGWFAVTVGAALRFRAPLP